MQPFYFPIEYRGLQLNAHRDGTGAEVLANLKTTYRVDRFDLSRLQQRDQREALHLLTGGDLGDATLPFRYISIAGTIVAPSGSKLSDMIAELNQRFDVEEAQLASLSTEGVSQLQFYDTTLISTGAGVAWTDPVTGLSDGERIQEYFMARPAGFPIITGRRSGGDTALFAVELVCPDPRRYLLNTEAPEANAGNGFSVSVPNWGTASGKATPPVITIIMSGAGATNLTIDITGDGVTGMILNMSAETAGTFTLDAATGLLKKGSTHRADLRTSAAPTLFPRVPRSGGTMNVTNTTGVTSVTATYHRARM